MKYCVCTAVNDKFAKGAEVMLYSFLSNNDWFEGDIVILSGEEPTPMHLSEENKERISNIYHKVKFKEQRFSHFNDIIKKFQYNALVGTESLVYKLSVFEMDEYDKILFLDADLLILGDIKELFDKNEPLVACPDRLDPLYANETWQKRTDEYFNFGIFVLNKPYIHENMQKELLSTFSHVNFDKITRSNPCHGLFIDQDLSNAYFLGKEVLLAPSKTYNFDRFSFDKGDNESVKIVHYLEVNKPWENCADSISTSTWKDYESRYNKWLSFYSMDWGEIKREYPKNYEDKDKYVVFTCAKNENEYIVEWIEHYLKLGFDKIFICDNNDDDSLIPIIENYIKKGTVEVFDCRMFKMFQGGVNKMFYNAGNFAWCAFFDCDEFLELHAYNNIKDYLKEKDEDCIAFNWLIFGSNGELKKNGLPVQERFKKPKFPINNAENTFLKCIVRGGHFKYTHVTDCGGHLPVSDEKGYTKEITYNIGGYYHQDQAPYLFQSSSPIRYKEGYIKHYYTKSFEEWIEKAKRGWPLNTNGLPYYRYFYLEDNGNYTSEAYSKSLFISKDYLEKYSESLVKFLNEESSVINYANEEGVAYAFLTKVEYVMSKVTGKTFIISGDKVDDEQFTALFECGFATGNRVVYAKTEEDIKRCFTMYKNENDKVYYYSIL